MVGVRLPLSEDLSALQREVKIGSKTAANSIAIQPMEGCDGTADGRPAELTLRRYDRFARSGARSYLGGGSRHHAGGPRQSAPAVADPGQSGRI